MKMRKVRDGNARPAKTDRNPYDPKTLPLNGPALAAAYSQLYPSGRSDAELYNLMPFRNTKVNPYSKQFLDPRGMVPTKGGPMRAAAIQNFKQTQIRNNPRFEDMGDGYVRVSGGRDVPGIFENRPLYDMLFRGYGNTESQLVVPNAGPEGEYVRWTSKPLGVKGAPPYARGDVWEFSMPSQPKPGATRGSSAMKRMSSMRKADSKSKKSDSMRNPEYVNIKRAPAKERLTDKMRARLNVLLGNAKQSIMDYKRDRLKRSLPISIDELGDKTPQEWREHLHRYPDNKVRPDEFLRMHDWEWHKLKQKEKEYLESIGIHEGKYKSKEESAPKESRPNKKPATSTAKRMSSVYKAMATKPISFRNKYM
jgi:hypothetical protein